MLLCVLLREYSAVFPRQFYDVLNTSCTAFCAFVFLDTNIPSSFILPLLLPWLLRSFSFSLSFLSFCVRYFLSFLLVFLCSLLSFFPSCLSVFVTFSLSFLPSCLSVFVTFSLSFLSFCVRYFLSFLLVFLCSLLCLLPSCLYVFVTYSLSFLSFCVHYFLSFLRVFLCYFLSFLLVFLYLLLSLFPSCQNDFPENWHRVVWFPWKLASCCLRQNDFPKKLHRVVYVKMISLKICIVLSMCCHRVIINKRSFESFIGLDLTVLCPALWSSVGVAV